jgi:hypothetical protein
MSATISGKHGNIAHRALVIQVATGKSVPTAQLSQKV